MESPEYPGHPEPGERPCPAEPRRKPPGSRQVRPLRRRPRRLPCPRGCGSGGEGKPPALSPRLRPGPQGSPLGKRRRGSAAPRLAALPPPPASPAARLLAPAGRAPAPGAALRPSSGSRLGGRGIFSSAPAPARRRPLLHGHQQLSERGRARRRRCAPGALPRPPGSSGDSLRLPRPPRTGLAFPPSRRAGEGRRSAPLPLIAPEARAAQAGLPARLPTPPGSLPPRRLPTA